MPLLCAEGLRFEIGAGQPHRNDQQDVSWRWVFGFAGVNLLQLPGKLCRAEARLGLIFSDTVLVLLVPLWSHPVFV